MKGASVAKTILAIMWELPTITVNSFFPHKYARKYCYSKNKNTVHTSLGRLCKNGLVKKNKDIFTLTSKGKKEAFLAFTNAEAHSFGIKKEVWDGKWRIIFFDIPETKRKHRDYLRFIIRTIGFREFQKSIWVYPYKIPSFLEEILDEENIKQYTRFITTESIDRDGDIRKMFKLT